VKCGSSDLIKLGQILTKSFQSGIKVGSILYTGAVSWQIIMSCTWDREWIDDNDVLPAPQSFVEPTYIFGIERSEVTCRCANSCHLGLCTNGLFFSLMLLKFKAIILLCRNVLLYSDQCLFCLFYDRIRFI